MIVATRKLVKSPEVTFDYDKRNESLLVTVELPGVDESDSFDLRMATCGFCVDAESVDIQYQGCYKFYHEVDPDDAEVKLKNGTLTIRVPFFAPLCGRQSPISFEL